MATVDSRAVPVFAEEAVDDRAAFIRRVYLNLYGAIVGFAVCEWAMFESGVAHAFSRWVFSVPLGWLFVMLGFVGVSWIASSFAHRMRSLGQQYFGLSLYVVAEALMFTPILWIANEFAPGTIVNAGLVTAIGFTGLTLIALRSGRDFSFLRPLIQFGFLIALGLIAGAMLFGFGLGLLFSIAMVGLAGASILYNTSAILRQYPREAHVAAALTLFAGVALMFWYVLQIFISLSGDD